MYLKCSFGFSTRLLFDDKKLPYHFMLERFVSSSGHNGLFRVFLWALNQSLLRWESAQLSATRSVNPLEDRTELPLVPEGTDEFLDSWLIFVEKLINQKTVLDPAHASEQEPFTYYARHLKRMQKMTFLAIMKLWGRRFGPVATGWGFWPRIVESMLTILKIIICREKLLRDVSCDEKKSSKTDATAKGQEGPSSTRETPEERRRRVDNQQQQPSMDTEDGAYFSSAISLDDQAESCGTSAPNRMIPNWERITELESADDMQTLIDNFRFNLVETCVGMLEDIPDYAQNDIIYHSAQLIKVNVLRNGEEYTKSILESLSNIINTRVTNLIEQMNMGDSECIFQMHFSAPDSLHVYSVIALYKLIFQEIKQPCAEIAHSSHMIDNLVKLLCRGTEVMAKYKHMTTPRWMASILQLLDLMEKVSLTTRRKSTMHDLTVDEWKWFDPGSGRWNCYQGQYNKAVDSAYWAGRKFCKFLHNRRNYTMVFRNMMQTNEETGKTRPIMRSYITPENAHKQKKHEPSIDDVNGPILFVGGPRQLESFDDCFFAHLGNTKPVEGIPERHIPTIMNAAVTLLKCTDNKETIQAALVLCVRFSREFKFAQFVAENDVVKTLLSLKSATPFIGFETLATILIRHILEEPATLEVAFEKVLRAKTLPNIPPSYKELNFILRECSAAVCRDMHAFKKVSENILRVDLAACARKAADPEEVRFLMKSIQTNTNKRKKKPLNREVDDSTRRTVYDLLNALVVEIEEKDPDEPAPSGAPTSPNERTFANLNSAAEHSHHQRHMMNHLANIVNGFDVHDHHIHIPLPTSNQIEDLAQMTGRKKNKVPLISKSCILKILSDAVRSYNTIALLITEYSYSGNKNSAVKEDCTAIAYILDNLMMQEEGMTDTERPNLARGLIAAVASCNHSPDAQMTLVNEVKSALNRALAMKESARKHQHVVDLVGIVTIMIENCPPVPLNSTPLSSSMKLSQYSVNNMVRFMMKKNIVIDLARISHTLDLSSPKLSATINAALKPLETLSRIMSCPPSNQNTNRVKTRQATAEAAAAARDQPGTSTSESTNAQGEDAVEDTTDNTDHDMSMSGPGDEENMDHRSAMRSELEDLIERVHNDLASDSPMIDDNEDEDANDGNDGNADYDDNSYDREEGDNGEDNAPRRNRGQMGNSSGEDSDSDPEDSDDRVAARRMDINDDDDESARPDGRMPPFHPFLMTRPNVLGGDGNHRGQRGMTSRIRRHPMDNHPAERLPYIGAPVPHHGHGHGLLHGHGLIHNADIVTATLSNNTRVVVMDNGLGIFTNTEEEQISYVDQSGYLSGPSLAATLNNVPTSMHWWNEESKLLDGDSEADAATVVGYDITDVVLKYRAEDMAKCKENMKKYVEQKRKKRGEDKKASSSSSHNDHSRVSSMDIFEPSSAGPVAETRRPSASASASSGSAGPSRVIDHAQLARNRDAIHCLAAAARFVSERSADNIVHSAIRTWPRPNDQPLPQPPSSAEQPYGSYEALVTFAPSFDQDLPSVEIRTDGARDDDEYSMPSVHSYQPSPIDSSDPPDDPPSDDPPSQPSGQANNDPPSQPSSQANNDPLQPAPSTQQSSQSSAPSLASTVILPRTRPLIMCDRSRVIHSTPTGFSRNREPQPQASTSAANNQANNQANNPPAEDPFAVYSLDSDPEDTPSESDRIFRVNPFSQNEGSSSQSQSEIMSSWLDNQDNAPNTSSQESQELSSGGSTQQQQLESQASSQLTDIPEGVDPSFLEALPEDMRAEVIQEHLRLQRMSARSSNGAGEASTSGAASLAILEVNADFLNALPPNIQAEVLAQQRLEQQRQAAAAANPNEPMDPAAFFEDMETDLRVAILTDMEDSQVAVLPPELAAEAQNLRREAESRNRQMHGRFVTHVTGTNGLSSILRAAGPRGPRGGGPRYTIQSLRGHQQHWSAWALRQHATYNIQRTQPIKPTARTRGRQILDYESICCLLILLFIDDNKLNTVRLHRVFRNLCYHAPTRDWIIMSLLSIMEKSNEGADTAEKPMMAATSSSNAAASSSSRQSKRIAARNGNSNDVQSTATQQPQPTPQSVITANALAWTRMESASTWLNISMDAALGCRATVFHVNKIPGRRTGTITINHQAAPFVYRHCLDLLISLAKTFPVSFVPKVQATTTNSSSSDANKKKDGTTFWEILVRLDASFNSKKGKSTPKNMQIKQQIEHTSLDTAPFGQLLRMLASPVVNKSSLLLNKLLRLLAVVSSALQVYKEPEQIAGDGFGILSNDTLRHVSVVADVLTSICCTEEGIQDATALLLHMSVRLKPIRQPIQNMLLDSCNSLAQKINEEIKTLMKEVIAYRKASKAENEEKNDETKTVAKGILSNRFTNDTVVVSAPKRVKTGLDLQLSAMGPLISKTSSQASMLRLLKVIVQIRSSTRAFETRNANKDDEENDDDEEEEEEEDEELFLQEEARSNDRQADEDGQGAGRERRRNNPTPLSQLLKLDDLWTSLSDCLCQLDKTQDTHACLVLQPAVEAFFIVHASSAEAAVPSKGSEQGSSQGRSQATSNQGSSQATSSQGGAGPSSELAAPPPLSPLPTDGLESEPSSQPETTQSKFLKFAETHRTVLNQILRQSSTPLVDGPFSVLVNHTRMLDFDVKRRYFRSELERVDEAVRREELALHVKRASIFEDSFRELHRRTPEEWKNRFYIVFEGEEGQDAGGLLREWYMIISREIFNPDYALFTTSEGDKVTYTINTSSHYNPNHLLYFKFVGRVIAKAIYDNKLLECYFTRSFYKHILGIPVKYTDMESEDYTFYKSLAYLKKNHISSIGSDLTFSTEVQEVGVTEVRELKPDGQNIPVTEENKLEYIHLVCQMKMTGAIRKQLDAFLEGFYDIIPNRLISIFNEQELELLISGLPNVDIDDLKANTEYYKYQPSSLQIQWFWRALREFNQAERAKFLQFVTGTSKVPLQGFSALEGMNGVQKFQIHRDERSTDRLPSAHTCFNQLDLPVYEDSQKLRNNLLKAIHECSEGFGFA